MDKVIFGVISAVLFLMSLYLFIQARKAQVQESYRRTPLMRLAAQLPTGIRDPKARDKFWAEMAELWQEVQKGDEIGALLEAADCLYYAQKSIANRLTTPAEYWLDLEMAMKRSGFPLEVIADAAIAKYTLRARPGNPKNDAEERAAVEPLVGAWRIQKTIDEDSGQ